MDNKMETAKARLNQGLVLAIAGDEFAKRGFDGVSMRDIAEKSGATLSPLYYHFGSKEALYEEACGYQLERFFQEVSDTLENLPVSQRSPDVLAEAMFDAFIKAPNPLLLTNRGVIDAVVAPDRWIIGKYYPRAIEIVRLLHSQYLSVEVDADFCSSFLAIVHGISSLMIIDQRFTTVGETSADPQAWAGHVQRKKADLLRCCRSLIGTTQV